METVMAGIEEVAGHRSVNYWNQKLLRFNEKYMKNILTHGEGHSFTDTMEMIYNIIPLHRTRKELPTDLVVEDDVFKITPAPAPPTVDDDQVQSEAKQKKRSFKSSIGYLTRVGSKNQRSSRSSLEEQKDVSEHDRRTLANAFARNAFYQLPEKDDVDDEREQREAREAKRQASEKRKNRWTTARTRLEVMAAETATGTADTEHSGQPEADDELAPLRRLLQAKRRSFFAAAEEAMQKKREEDRKPQDDNEQEVKVDIVELHECPAATDSDQQASTATEIESSHKSGDDATDQKRTDDVV